MNDDSQEEKPTHSTFARYRSPTFSKNEVNTLLSLIEYHKGIILNKSTSTAACHAKECAWAEITKGFNSNGFKNKRSAESLKVKWDNLKKVAKKISKNLLDVTNNDFDDVTSRTVAMLCEAENINFSLEKRLESDEELNESESQKQSQDLHNWNDGEDQDLHVSDNDGDNENQRFLNRSMNFSPQECNLLIQCVRQEKKFVLSKANTSGANKLKNRAWFRITNNYNKLSPQKRSTKMLRTKFSNMKKMAKSVSFKNYLKDVNRKQNKLNEDDDKKIKSEPPYEYKDHSELDNDIDDSHNEINEISSNTINLVSDPLSTTLNGDSGIDLINPLENKEIVRLKMDLLHYQMETAKLERKRIEEAIQAQSLENALRLRAARLEAVAAADKLSPAHPALAFTPDEARAHHCLAHCT
ncbi:eukaryotic translation initiation factor 3 subunit C isoform X2 [Manduca sexta]|uniref:Regulatory protein zeste n=1 Tax=Manduca sexta TaxID=7130 RepID=A0A922CG82_MANSE|nr:eukaryotic translation initiation factor 3 subunit C isoform X2 [Manduca sexta]KAG6444784.1 hypothetical protein O3G_MSEX003526 [Manduca sexta]